MALVVLVLLSLGVPEGDAGTREARRYPLSTCFWEGPISMRRPSTRGFDGRDFNFPEQSATYWLARFRLPDGSRLRLRGRYAHVRYQSLNAYSNGEPTDSLPDVQTRPNPGSTNPFIAGHRRDRHKRRYAVEVVDKAPPGEASAREPNTLYARPSGDAAIELLYRTYEPDKGRGLTGGTGLPSPRLALADGARLRGQGACDAINTADRSITVQTTPDYQWQAFWNAPGCNPAAAPAVNPVRWKRFFNFDHARLGVALGCSDAANLAHQQIAAEDRGGFYSNRDIRYLYAFASRHFGQVLVVQAKMPTVPRTRKGKRRMGRGQLRYWSLCSAESAVTSRSEDCLADREVPLDGARNFTIVVSTPEERPVNALRRCGVAWLRWPQRGDGAGRPDFATLIVRNMLPAPGFTEAIQNVRKLGTEQEVMGPYLPRASYTGKDTFEATGCPD
ncbi:MAG: hypothetical protein AABM29_07820 [Actinomycetota bacterium]